MSIQKLNYAFSSIIPILSCANAVPLALLQTEIPKQAERSDSNYFYFRCPAFERLCQDYAVADTAILLYQLNLLKCRSDSFTYPAKPNLFGESCPEVFAIKKSIIDLGDLQ
ncbi:MAG: hypothetical protein ACXW04_01150 [Methylobacter sp.]